MSANVRKFLFLAEEVAVEVMEDKKQGETKDLDTILYSRIGILYIEPKGILQEPVIDSVTKGGRSSCPSAGGTLKDIFADANPDGHVGFLS